MPLTEEQRMQQAARQQIQAAPQQEQVLQNELQNQAVREAELQRLQTEQAAPAEETRLEEVQANEALVAEVRQELPAVEAAGAAMGAPVQEQEPAPSTWKERRTERKKAEAARKASPAGTAATYDMVEQLKERRKMTNHFAKPYLEQAARKGIDKRYLLSFCQGYRKNRFGFPASEEDKRRKERDERFLQNFCLGIVDSDGLEVGNIMDDILSTPFSLDMFSPRSLRHNLAELKCLGERLASIQNLKNDYPGYFQSLQATNPGKWEQIRAAETLGGAFVPLLEAHCRKNGVDTDAAGYLGKDREDTIRDGRESLDTLTETFQAALKEFRRISVYGEYGDELTSIRGWAAVDEEEHEKLKRMASGEMGHLRQADQVFESLMQDLEQNKDQKPSVDLYARTRAFAAPLVQRVMDCYLDYMLDLPVSMLVTSHAEELEKLARESRLASELLRLQHPLHTARRQNRLMLQDELLGSRENEFTYRCAMVQALAKKARMYALLANGTVENMRIGGEYLTEEERREAGDAPEFMIRQKILDAEEEMQAAKKRYQDVRTPGTEEFKSWAKDIIDRGKLEREVIDIKYEPVLSEFEKRETPEIQQAMDRIQDKQYYSLEYTKEQAEALGMTENIGEPVFRSFDPFLKKEATKKLLSPEEFRRMVLDLGAGAGMHCGTWESRKVEKVVDDNGEEHMERRTVQHPGTPREELEPAIQKNRAGLAVYKRIMRAQYDMLTRKYGLGLENLDIEDMVDYCNDFFRDFGETQVEDHMVSRFPGFLDLEDEKDKLLFYRIKYYGVVGWGVYALYSHLDPEAASEIHPLLQSKRDIQKYMQDSLNDPQVVEAREYLLMHDEYFRDRRVDRYVKVRTPE